jgi:hypothetical protein
MALVVVVFFVAAGLRSYRLAEVPPGVEHDEVAEWQIARGILSGHHALFFREAYGQEPCIFLQAVSIFFLGDHVFALRFTSFAVAMLTMAACFRMMRRLFGSPGALVSLALMTVALWPMFFARVAIRGMMLPLVLCLAADAALSGLKSPISQLQPQVGQSANRQLLSGIWLDYRVLIWPRAVPILLVGFSASSAVCAGTDRGKCAAELRCWPLPRSWSPLAVYLWRQPDVHSLSVKCRVARPTRRVTFRRVGRGVYSSHIFVRGDQTVRDNWPYRPYSSSR